MKKIITFVLIIISVTLITVGFYNHYKWKKVAQHWFTQSVELQKNLEMIDGEMTKLSVYGGLRGFYSLPEGTATTSYMYLTKNCTPTKTLYPSEEVDLYRLTCN